MDEFDPFEQVRSILKRNEHGVDTKEEVELNLKNLGAA